MFWISRVEHHLVERGLRTFVVAAAIASLAGCGAEQQAAAECALIAAKFAHERKPQQLFQKKGGTCSPADIHRSGDYFSDAGCTTPVEFTGQSFDQYCRRSLSEGSESEPGRWPAEKRALKPVIASATETKWEVAYGSSLSVINVALGDAPAPLRKRVVFRTAGQCQLAMNVYTQDAGRKNLKVAMYIHGGGWRSRNGASDAVMDYMGAALAARGYIVFSPYYRLLKSSSDVDGTCKVENGEAIAEDVLAGTDWVLKNAASFGASPGATDNIYVVGHSAGAQLAARVLEERSQVTRGLLAYGPIDMDFAIRGYASGLYGEDDALWRSMAEFLGLSGASELKRADVLALPLVAENTIVRQEQIAKLSTKSIDILHGAEDKIVPVEAATRACDALAGRELRVTRYDGGQSLNAQCGDHARLHVIEGAQHGMEHRCLAGDRQLSLLNKLVELLTGEAVFSCPSGSVANDAIVNQTYEEILGRRL